jgi:hypothetical protein
MEVIMKHVIVDIALSTEQNGDIRFMRKKGPYYDKASSLQPGDRLELPYIQKPRMVQRITTDFKKRHVHIVIAPIRFENNNLRDSYIAALLKDDWHCL